MNQSTWERKLLQQSCLWISCKRIIKREQQNNCKLQESLALESQYKQQQQQQQQKMNPILEFMLTQKHHKHKKQRKKKKNSLKFSCV
jgi:hypothetical protein